MTLTTVVKLGGSLLEHAASRHDALATIASEWQRSHSLVLVHGGGKRIDHVSSKLGLPKRTQQGLRITDAAMLDVVVSVLAGTVNSTLVGELQAIGVKAVGLSGIDGATLQADFHPPVHTVDLGFVGQVTHTDPTLVHSLITSGFFPVVGSVALGPKGTPLNVNADAAASSLAIAIGADRLIFLTDVEGVLDSAGQIVEILNVAEARAILAGHAVSGGMKPKLLAAIDAISAGVREVVIAGPTCHADALAGGKGGTHLVAA